MGFVSFLGAVITIVLGISIAWYWAAFISEIIGRRFDTRRFVPYLDDFLWKCFGLLFLNLGFFGGVSTLEQRLERAYRMHQQKKMFRSLNIAPGNEVWVPGPMLARSLMAAEPKRPAIPVRADRERQGRLN